MLPLGSMSARISSPQWPPFMLAGSVGQPSSRRYGLGRSACLGYCFSWARAEGPSAADAARTAISVKFVSLKKFIASPFGRRSAKENMGPFDHEDARPVPKNTRRFTENVLRERNDRYKTILLRW